MIIESGRIVALQADKLWVDVVQKSTCGACQAKSACGHGLANEWSSKSANVCMEVTISPDKAQHYHIGDNVKIAISESGLLLSVVLMYILPLMSLIAVAMLTALLTDQQWLVAISSFIAMLTTFGLLRFILARFTLKSCHVQLLDNHLHDTEAVKIEPPH